LRIFSERGATGKSFPINYRVKSEYQSPLDADESERNPSAEWSRDRRYLPV